MLGVTWRQRALSAGALALALTASVAAVFELWRVAGAAVGLLIGAVAVALLDLRRRTGDVTRRLKAGAEQRTRLARSVGENRNKLANIDRTVVDLRAQTENQLGSVEWQIGELEKALLPRRLRELVVTPVNDHVQMQADGLLKRQLREIEGLLQLFARVESAEPMPPSGDWALNPQGLLSLVTLVERQRPRVVVELGSGTSTVWLGYALAAVPSAPATNGTGRSPRLISLEHDERYAAESRGGIRHHESAMAPTEVRMAPLTTVQVRDEEFQWYDPAALSDIDAIDLLIVDGPPGSTGPLARYPAVPVLRDKLTDGALVVLDDADRDDEAKIVERWMQEVPGLAREWNRTDRQVVLRYSAHPAQP